MEPIPCRLVGDFLLTFNLTLVAVTFTVDSATLDPVTKALSLIARNQNKIAAQAITGATIKAKEAIQSQIFPRIEGGPTRWTQRGLIAFYAQPNDLTAMVGFNYDQPGQGSSPYSKKRNIDKLIDSGQSSFKGGGTPSGRYMEINARGGTRSQKSSELQMQRAGITKGKQYLVTNRNLDDLDSHGNLPGPVYQRMLSKIDALQTEGSTQSSKRPRRGRKNPNYDYFVMRERTSVKTVKGNLNARSITRIGRQYGESQTGINQLLTLQLGKPIFIARRVGVNKRGFEPVWWVTDNVRYSNKFPIKSVALREFQRVFPDRYRKALENQGRK